MKTRTVISKSAKRRSIPKGSSIYHFTEMVVYREKLPNGKYISTTAHEIVGK